LWASGIHSWDDADRFEKRFCRVSARLKHKLDDYYQQFLLTHHFHKYEFRKNHRFAGVLCGCAFSKGHQPRGSKYESGKVGIEEPRLARENFNPFLANR